MDTIFDELEGFSVTEAWGKPLRLSGLTLMLLHFVRREVRKLDPEASFVIHNAVEAGGHSGNSQHYEPRACAVDFHIVTKIPYHELIGQLLLIFEKLQIAERIGFGIYPHWNSPGFHIDTRGSKARWGYILNKNKNTAVSFDKAYETARG